MSSIVIQRDYFHAGLYTSITLADSEILTPSTPRYLTIDWDDGTVETFTIYEYYTTYGHAYTRTSVQSHVPTINVSITRGGITSTDSMYLGLGNDSYANAFDFSGSVNVNWPYPVVDTPPYWAVIAFATKESGEPDRHRTNIPDPVGLGPSEISFWFKYTPTTNGSIHLTGASYGSSTFACAVYTGGTSASNPGTKLAEGSGVNPVRVTAGVTYYIVVESWDAYNIWPSRFGLHWHPLAIGDDFTNPGIIPSSTQGSFPMGVLDFMTGVPDEMWHLFGDTFYQQRSLWYHWIAPKTGKVNFGFAYRIEGNSYDGAYDVQGLNFSIFRTSDITQVPTRFYQPNPLPVTRNPGGDTVRYTFDVIAGIEYTFEIFAGYDSGFGIYDAVAGYNASSSGPYGLYGQPFYWFWYFVPSTREISTELVILAQELNEGYNPDFMQNMQTFGQPFNQLRAVTTGQITPGPGTRGLTRFGPQFGLTNYYFEYDTFGGTTAPNGDLFLPFYRQWASYHDVIGDDTLPPENASRTSRPFVVPYRGTPHNFGDTTAATLNADGVIDAYNVIYHGGKVWSFGYYPLNEVNVWNVDGTHHAQYTSPGNGNYYSINDNQFVYSRTTGTLASNDLWIWTPGDSDNEHQQVVSTLTTLQGPRGVGARLVGASQDPSTGIIWVILDGSLNYKSTQPPEPDPPGIVFQDVYTLTAVYPNGALPTRGKFPITLGGEHNDYNPVRHMILEDGDIFPPRLDVFERFWGPVVDPVVSKYVYFGRYWAPYSGKRWEVTDGNVWQVPVLPDRYQWVKANSIYRFNTETTEVVLVAHMEVPNSNVYPVPPSDDRNNDLWWYCEDGRMHAGWLPFRPDIQIHGQTSNTQFHPRPTGGTT